MAIGAEVARVAWWREPTKDQWYAWWAAWLGWTLDAFDFTVFLLIMKPIADEFGVPVSEVAWILALTLWMRLLGAVGSGWLADRIGRKTPLMISIFWYSICNFIAGFSPTLLFLLVFRTLLGIGMGAEWPAGAALAMEQWPIRSRGFMSGVLQGSWSIGFLLSSVIWGVFGDLIGWRGMLWIGVLPALSIVYIRYFVTEPPIWVENRRQQRESQHEVRATASAFCYHQGAIFGGFVAPVLAYFAVNFGLGYGTPMLFGTVAAAVSVVIALSLSPETKGRELTADLAVAGADD
jgi:MFS transporter, SHS family, lactate transporter